MYTNYTRGVVKERQAMKELQDAGYECCRAAGSHGTFDLIAYNENEIRFIQTKREKGKLNPALIGKSVYKDDVTAILKAKVPSSVSSRELWVWVDRHGWTKVIFPKEVIKGASYGKEK